MNLNNTDRDTHSYDKTSNEYNSSILKRNRANSAISVPNGYSNGQCNNKHGNSNIYNSPAMSISSTQTTPLTNPHHHHVHSRSSSLNSNYSSIRYNNLKTIVNKNENSRDSPLLKNSNLKFIKNNGGNNYKNISNEISDNKFEKKKIFSESSKPLSVRKDSKDSFAHDSLNVLKIENDVTSQLHKTHSNDLTDNIMVSNKKILKEDNLIKNNNIPVLLNKPKDNDIDTHMNYSEKENILIHPASSDIGSYFVSNNQIKPKSSISYQYDSNTKTLRNSNTATLNNLAANMNNYSLNNYVNANYLDVRKKYSSCYSISSNSTILAPPKKYLNHNYSIYNYPKIKHMFYVVIIMLTIYIISLFTLFSTRWIIVNTKWTNSTQNEAAETIETINHNLIYHYEFGMYNFCYKDNSENSNSQDGVCNSIEKYCPFFCTETSCINFNPKNEGKSFEDKIVVEDSTDPEYSFCKLTSRSRNISVIYISLFTLNLAIAISILCITIKYHGNDKKNLKSKLIKRLSYISEHYSVPSKFKNSNNNIASSSNNNSTSYLNNNVNEISNIELHRQFSEPETYDIDNDTVKSRPTSNNENNNNNNNNSRNQRYHSYSAHITYNLPNSATRSIENNSNISPSNNNSPIIQTASIMEQNKIAEEKEKEILKTRRILRTLFSFLIIFSFILGLTGIYYIKKWYKEHRHIGMFYLKDTDIVKSDITLDVSIGVSLILICIVSAVNIIISLYLIILLSIIHHSKSKTYWHNDNDEDTYSHYSQSYDSLHPPSIYSQNNFNYNSNNGYNQSTSNIIP
ncbi:hypothetical protein BCR36DRAFT_372049 [Piromyces finnis]|uniref:Uncharacterized protein n=1 Tax=Piromyces finnis TaxID=1754191 RepID=A0A1Y1V3P2_9FUNG|nr:hypothetical protein BCR36DRAFT_372049 [Piromyces finnis]|eukprot:ORX46583.1 hypothetical protein BCR36DRAFT_372049 [Piromyces finnis]